MKPRTDELGILIDLRENTTGGPPAPADTAKLLAGALTCPVVGDVDLAGFGRALEVAIRSAGISQAQIARDMNEYPATIGNWVRGSNPPANPQKVFELERVVGVKPGQLSRFLGYVPVEAARRTPTFLDALAESGLSAEHQLTIRHVYESFLPKPSRTRPRSPR